MSKHFDILIDASGSMGLLKDKDGNVDVNYLLPDGKTTRTELVKKILVNSMIPKLSFVDSLSISTFSSKVILNDFGKPKLKANQKQYYPDLDNVYKGDYIIDNITFSLDKISVPFDAGTPLSWALQYTINTSKKDEINIIVFSDGDASDEVNFDIVFLKRISEIKKPCKIYFIGIAQNEEAKRKSENLAVKTGGFYVNLQAINYDETAFDNMLFEFNTTIISNELSENLNAKPKIVEDVSVTIENKIESNIIEEVKEDITIEEKVIQKDIEPLDLKKQVEENTRSLQLITSQLDSIVKQISFIGKEKSNDKDEFEANEDEERNRVIGKKCEVFLFNELVKQFPNINWLNKEKEQYKPYDFDLDFKNEKYYYECKGSVSNTKEFFLTKLEWEFYLKNRNHYRLFFVSNIDTDEPTHTRINDLLESMSKGELIPCSTVNRKVKADRILFQIIN
jgi:hypothetical protein